MRYKPGPSCAGEGPGFFLRTKWLENQDAADAKQATPQRRFGRSSTIPLQSKTHDSTHAQAQASGLSATSRSTAALPRQSTSKSPAKMAAPSKSPSPVPVLYLPPLRAYQLPLIASEARDDVTVSAPQLGKTVCLALWALVGAWRDADAGVVLPTWWTSPTYLMAEQGIEKLAEMGRSAGLVKDSRLKPYPRVMLRNGGWIDGRSWDQPDMLFGPTVARIAVDEFGYLTTEAHAALRSRVSETRIRGLGYMRYAGNVGEIGGEAERLYAHASSGAVGWAARTWTWRDRAKAASCDCGLNGDALAIETADKHDGACERGRYLVELKDLQSRMSSAHFRQLYGAEWLDWSALPAYQFDRTVHVTDAVELQPSLPLDLSVDFNVDPMAWVIGQHIRDAAWAWDEIALDGGSTTEQACREFIRRYPDKRRHVVVYGDASGGARKTSASESDYQIIRRQLGGYYAQLQLRVPASNPAVSDRLNAFNAMLAPGTGETRYHVHPRCSRLANDLARVSLKPGTREIDKSDRSLTHFSDADGYRIAWEFPVRGIAAPASGPVGSAEQFTRTDPVLGARW